MAEFPTNEENLITDPTSQGALIYDKALYKKAQSHQNLNGKGKILLQNWLIPQQSSYSEVIFRITYSTTVMNFDIDSKQSVPTNGPTITESARKKEESNLHIHLKWLTVC